MPCPTRARYLITKIQKSRQRHNPDVQEMCRMLATLLDLGDLGDPEPPPRELHAVDRRRYMRLYMRWRRWKGQSGKPGNQHGSECRPRNKSSWRESAASVT